MRPAGWMTAPGAGLCVGGLAGLLEVLFQVGRSGSAIQRAHLFEAALLYGIAGCLLGFLLLAAMLLLRRRAPSRSLTVAVPVAAFGFLLVAGYVNLYYLPEAMARASLIYTGGILVGAVLLGVCVYSVARAVARGRAPRRSGDRGDGATPRCRWAGWALGTGVALILALVSYLPVPSGSDRAAGDATGKPNVLIILIDAVRYDHLSIHGYARETSPWIDAFAGAGILFERAYAQTSWTKPSTASILTGLYPSAHGVNLMASGVPVSAPLLAETMRGAGYRTGLFTANSFITPMFGFGRGVDHFYASNPPRLVQLMMGHLLHRLTEWSEVAKGLFRLLETIERALIGGGAPEGGLRADGLTRAFLDWLDEEVFAGAAGAGEAGAGDANPQRPFFAYLHLMEPHVPYDPPPPDDGRFLTPRLARLGRVSYFPAYHGFLPFERGPEISADSLANMLALYDGEIFHADRWLGALFNELDRRELTKETLIVLTADHGEEFCERGGWGHGHSLYNELLHVPLMMSCPQVPGLQGHGGRTISHIVRHIDLVPTILEICDISAPSALDGASLIPILTGAEMREPPRPLYSEVDHGGHYAYALQRGPQKVILSRRGGETSLMLFDLASDPGEQRDLAGEQPARAEAAHEELEEFRAAVREGARQAVDVTIDEATRERLRGLGYVR
ncbi:MAG: sulfatase [Candidatus Eisenbacteria sp.]|nr:sulfatase [Candidatus Eisenbacteria bacterium]